jgi:hypothetical protein
VDIFKPTLINASHLQRIAFVAGVASANLNWPSLPVIDECLSMKGLQCERRFVRVTVCIGRISFWEGYPQQDDYGTRYSFRIIVGYRRSHCTRTPKKETQIQIVLFSNYAMQFAHIDCTDSQ